MEEPQAGELKVSHHGCEVVNRSDAVDRGQWRFQRGGVGAIDGWFVDARREVVADTFLVRGPARGGSRVLFEYSPEEAAIVLLELRVDRPRRLVGRKRVAPDPTAARVCVEVHARIH